MSAPSSPVLGVPFSSGCSGASAGWQLKELSGGARLAWVWLLLSALGKRSQTRSVGQLEMMAASTSCTRFDQRGVRFLGQTGSAVAVSFESGCYIGCWGGRRPGWPLFAQPVRCRTVRAAAERRGCLVMTVRHAMQRPARMTEQDCWYYRYSTEYAHCIVRTHKVPVA